MRPLRSTLHHARAASAVSGARPAYAAGLRAAIASVAPLVLGHLLHSGGGVWMSIAGLNGAFADNGGPYRTRARTMSVLALASAVAIALGTLVAGHLALAVAVTFALGALCSLARVWGDAGSVVGVTVLLVFVIGLALPPGPHAVPSHEAVARAGWVVAGGAWAMLVALVLWPIRPWAPLRLAVAACWEALAGYLDDVARRTGEGLSHDAWALRDSVVAMRTALERARGALAVTRRGRPAQSGRGEQLLVLHEMSDQAFVHLVALTDAVESVAGAERSPGADAALVATLGCMAASARAVAAAIVAPRADPVPMEGCSGAELRLQLAADASGGGADAATAHYAHGAALLDRVAEYLAAAGTVARGLEGEHAVTLPPELLTAEEPPRPSWLTTAVQSVTAADSLVLRHALRVALVTAIAVWLTGALHLARGYWVTITVVIVLQPYTGATTQKALQRVGGTVLGGIIAAVLSSALHDPVAIMALVFVFTALCVAVLPLNYGMYAVLGTPAFVLLAEVSASDWHLSGLRIVNTILGGALALAGTALLRAGPEARRVSDYAAAALRADAAYLRQAIALAASAATERAVGTLREARRAISLAAANAEDSFQRLLGEHGGPPEALEPLMALITYTRRLAASIGALALTYETPSPAAREALERLGRDAGAILDDLADAVVAGRAPAPLPPIGSEYLAEGDASPVLRGRVRRITRQLRSLHDAVEHWTAVPAASRVGRDSSAGSARTAA